VEIFAPREWRPDDATRARARAFAEAHPWSREALTKVADGQLFDGMEGWMVLLATEPSTLANECSSAHHVLIDPTRCSSRSRELRDEEASLVEAIAATWGVEEPLALLHQDFDELVSGLDYRAVTSVPRSAGAHVWPVSSPPSVVGDPGRLAAHVRGWEPSRRGVVAASSSAAAERMAEQLRGEGLAVTSDEGATLDVTISVVVAPLAHGAHFDVPALTVWGESDITRSAGRAPGTASALARDRRLFRRSGRR
jgi:transcription-repair coupling factor (superfamily II helicase)